MINTTIKNTLTQIHLLAFSYKTLGSGEATERLALVRKLQHHRVELDAKNDETVGEFILDIGDMTTNFRLVCSQLLGWADSKMKGNS